MEFVKDPYGTGHHLYLDNFYTRPVLFNLLRAKGILAAGTARPRQWYPSNDLKSVQLERRGPSCLANLGGDGCTEVERQKRCPLPQYDTYSS